MKNYIQKVAWALVLLLAATLSLSAKDGTAVRKLFKKGVTDSISVGGSKLVVLQKDLIRNRSLSVNSIGEENVPELDFAMTNVTAGGHGYRFLPHGTHFTGEGATVKIKYDRTRIPSGYTEDDIRTYYYDPAEKHWVALERVRVDKKEECVVSKTTHFTDMINGVIQAPESPQTEGFAPTMMNDIKAADPTAKINVIAPPSANNRGSANLQYPFEMPPARNGMQPSLGLQYSSEGGSGWLGEGWNVSVPSITLDTRWGVPRYDQSKETETYLLSGSMLSTMDDNGQMGVAHRGEKMNRKADRQFYTRQGGDFSRIIRKGDSPANYYWEVTDKQGVKYIYGGDGAVVKGNVTDASGSTREVIAEWKLKRVEELHGDYIEYVYDIVDEDVRGGLKAKAAYLKEVHAGNAGQEPHTVVLFDGNKVKQVKTNNARYGFLASSNRLLEKVTVNFQGETLRSYAFDYKEGAFHKEMLTGVRQYDNTGKEVAFQNFDYYDDVQAEKGYVPFKDDSEKWNTHDDGLDAGFINPLKAVSKRFSDKPTALGGTTSSSVSGSFYAGVGPWDGSKWKSNTIGGSYSYSSDTSKGLSAFVDLNGDGLPDKVYKSGGSVYYRPQVKTDNGEVVYGEPVKVKGISNFSTTKSSTNSFGAKAVVGWNVLTAVVGTDKSTTKTKTTQYFSDINGDGLVDLVSNGKVYFNHLEFDQSGNAVPTFTLSSADTPSPIIYGGKVDTSVMEVSKDEQAEAIKNSPMEDIVRVWQAPKDGTVSVTGQVSLIAPTDDYDADEYQKADGVRIAIQKGGNELWNKTIAKGDNSPYSAAVSSVAVKRGDRIYFRVQSGSEETSNGSFDKVSWSPTITYAGESNILPNGLSSTEYKPEDGAIYDVNTSANVENGSSVEVRSAFHKPVTTDDVVLCIIGSNEKKDSDGNDNPNYIEKTVFARTLKANEAFGGDSLNISLENTEKLTNFSFEISSTSNVDWKNIGWQASVTYKDSANIEQTVAVPAHYKIFANALAEGKPYLTTATDTVLVVSPVLILSDNSINGQVTLTAKTEDALIGKKSFNIENGILKADTLRFAMTAGKNIWFEYSYPAAISNETVTSASVSILKDAAGLVTENVLAGFYAENDNLGFGMLYRGWGGFVYNSAEGRYAKPIDESLLKLPENENDKVDPLTMAFTPLGTDQTSMDKWVGQRQDIYLTATEASTARLTEQDVLLTNPLDNNAEVAGLAGEYLQGTGAAAVSQVVSSKSTVVQGGALGITHNNANGSSKTEVAMMDMNGDGFPDIIAGGSIQYTNSQGGLSGEIYKGIGANNSDNASEAWGYGGNPVASVSDITKLISGSKSSAQNQQSSWLAQFSISGSAPKNTDEAVESFIDINGDGLPDKILSDKIVRLNLGYAFTEPIDWGLDRIQSGKSLSYNIGAGGDVSHDWGKFEDEKYQGINKASGSFSAGFGLVTSESEEEYNLIDINSDGLPDKVWKNGDGITVALNTGNGFDEPISWKGASALSESASTSESANAAFTLTINIPVISIKISTNPGASTSHSINRPTYSLQDVDGDGYLDIVESEKESELKVTRSAIGRTNMLKSVTNSLGGTFTLDYAHTTPTYGLPGGKWVMSALTVDDGIHDDGPVMTTAFEYKDGKRDRHEREFLGFGEVITKNLDTEKGNSVYRQAVENYDVANYYTQGNVTATSVEDANGNKYTETKNRYDSYYLTADGDKYTFAKRDVNLWSDRASAFVPLRYTANLQYEGAANGVVTSEAWNEYYLNGYHGELKSYKYSDKGSLGEDGNGKFDYATAIKYTDNASKHIFGLPVDVTVTGGDGSLYHHVTAKYNTNYANHITQITQQLNDGEAVTDYKYDSYGNITQKTLPANGKGQRMWYKYRYEPEMNMYVERIDDAWGYRSEQGNFDYRYGIAKEHRDLNNFYYETDVDDLGRITGVRGPNELATGVPYAIAFEYQPLATFGESGITAPAYAVTKHYDIQHPNDDLETVTFVDGFGRAVQVKKDGVVTSASKGNSAKDENVMIVSGRNVYDAFGRVAKAFYPTTEGTGSKSTFNKSFDNVSPTVTVYDVLDRATSVTLPDNSTTTTAYTVDNGSHALVTTVTDALHNVQATHTNGSGKTLKSIQKSGPDGERTVKTSGESDQVYVNSEFAGGRTNTAKFSLYVSPYLVANQGGRYTKHIYIGSQRVVSKIGDFDSYGSDPRRIQYAGSETDGLSVDYKVKYTQQLQVIKDNYATFAVPYNGEDNNDYVDGKGFCCNDGSLEAAQARALARAAKNNFQEGDSYEKMQFYYHPDHLGSSSYITNLDGEVVQHIEYVPFGEVFVEERNNIWNTPYLFNAKEFDEETGLYYYGARYYDPRVSLWTTTDPLEEEYPNITTYGFCHNNPVVLVDPDGMGDYYNKAGRWLGNDGRKDNIAYLADAVSKDKAGRNHFQNANVLSLKNSELNIFANTVAQESSGNKIESFALASAIKNLADYKGKSIMQTIQTEGIFGYRDGGNNTQYNNNAEYGMAAVLNAITGGKDFSNGAIRWDGFDLAIKGWEHVKSKNQGLGISRSHYQTFYSYWAGGNRLKNASGNKNAIFNPEFQMLGKKLTYSPAIQGYWKGMVLYNSSAAYGGTIFWRPVSNFIIKGVNLNRNFRKVNGSKNKPL